MIGFKSEAAFDRHLFAAKGLATVFGHRLSYHHPYALGADPGFPDRVIVGHRLIVVELKYGKNTPTEKQRTWLTGFAKAGVEVYLWYPEDLDEIEQILKGKWVWERHGHGLVRPDAVRSDLWRPSSLWMTGGYRSDLKVGVT